MKPIEIERSDVKILWDELRLRALTFEELVDATELDHEYVNVTLHRMMKKGFVKYGKPVGNRRTYTARGVRVQPAFNPRRGAVQEAVYGLVKAHPGATVEDLAKAIVGASLFSVRNALTRLHDRGLVTSQYEGRIKRYEVTKHGKRA